MQPPPPLSRSLALPCNADVDSYGIFGMPVGSGGGSVLALGGALGVPGPDGTRTFAFPAAAYTPGAAYTFHAFAFTAAGKGADSSVYLFTAPACTGIAGMQAYPAATAASSFAAAVAPPASPSPARLGNVRVPTPSAEDQAAMDAMVDSIVQLLLAASQ